MVYIGIDPSFTRTGVTVWRSPSDYSVHSISAAKENFVITEALVHALSICKGVRNVIIEQPEYEIDQIVIGVEYPILATRLGAYLAILTAKLDSLFRSLNVGKVYYIPSVACKAYVKYNNKTELVQWVKDSGLANSFKGNHDEATALVLANIAKEISEGKYKKSFLELTY